VYRWRTELGDFASSVVAYGEFLSRQVGRDAATCRIPLDRVWVLSLELQRTICADQIAAVNALKALCDRADAEVSAPPVGQVVPYLPAITIERLPLIPSLRHDRHLLPSGGGRLIGSKNSLPDVVNVPRIMTMVARRYWLNLSALRRCW
jgi:hypothetical protein